MQYAFISTDIGEKIATPLQRHERNVIVPRSTQRCRSMLQSWSGCVRRSQQHGVVERLLLETIRTSIGRKTRLVGKKIHPLTDPWTPNGMEQGCNADGCEPLRPERCMWDLLSNIT